VPFFRAYFVTLLIAAAIGIVNASLSLSLFDAEHSLLLVPPGVLAAEFVLRFERMALSRRTGLIMQRFADSNQSHAHSQSLQSPSRLLPAARCGAHHGAEPLDTVPAYRRGTFPNTHSSRRSGLRMVQRRVASLGRQPGGLPSDRSSTIKRFRQLGGNAAAIAITGTRPERRNAMGSIMAARQDRFS
jgi:hypothetical protein